MVEQPCSTITSIRKDLGMSILLVEQNAGIALELTSRVYAMQTGQIVLSGPTEGVSLEQIHEAYLGRVPASSG
jgi:branched-chain amino acid transport system ATP-binding protein